MDSSEKRIAANRRNAAKSTGPKTESGKAIAARNALKHGLLAREIVIDAGEGAESQDQFDAVLVTLTNQFDPQGPLEEMLVEKIAVAYWRLRRAHRYEAGLIRQKLDNATDAYYAGSTNSLGRSTSERRDDEIDAKIREAQELHDAWRSDSKEFTGMHKAGKALDETYEWQENWEFLWDKVERTLEEDREDESPAAIREAMNKSGWSDDKIWAAHLELCTEQMKIHSEAILALEKEKEANRVAIQVRKKLGCIPEGFGLERLLKYEGSIEKQFYRAIDQLERLQRLRAGDNVPAPVAIDITTDQKAES